MAFHSLLMKMEMLRSTLNLKLNKRNSFKKITQIKTKILKIPKANNESIGRDIFVQENFFRVHKLLESIKTSSTRVSERFTNRGQAVSSFQGLQNSANTF
jgi:hypothetical protein